jgi:hypothetical protein
MGNGAEQRHDAQVKINLIFDKNPSRSNAGGIFF